MIRFQQHRLLGWLFAYLLIIIQGHSVAYAQKFWDIQSLPVSQSTSVFFESNPEISLIWGYQKGEWSAAAKPFTSQAARLSELSTSSTHFSFLSTVQAGRSYWLLSANATTASSIHTSSIELPTFGPGYHLVSGTGESVGIFLEKHPEVSQIWAWDQNRRNYSIAEQGQFPEYEGLDKVQILNLGQGYWIKVDHQFSSYERNSMLKAVKEHAADVDSVGNIFSHGGITDQGFSNELFKYEIRNDSWSVLPSSLD